MAEDPRLAALLRTCADEFRAGPPDRTRVLDFLEALETLSPGLLQQAASRALLKRLPLAPVH